MNEWKNIDEAPKDGTRILAFVETVISEFYEMIYFNSPSNRWLDQYQNSFLPEQIKGWSPLPDRPKKEHKCYSSCCVCHSNKDGFFLDIYNNNEERLDVFTRIDITYCPFCGGKSDVKSSL